MNQQVKTVPHHDALIYAMVTISAADRTMTDRELKTIGDIVQTLPIFVDFDKERLVETAEACGSLMQGDDGLRTVLNVIAASLPPKLYETAYALAVDVAAADLHVEQEELRFLQLLRDRLDLEKLVVAAIERGARARHAVR
ncbi:MAG: tellurite resistance TerB family protein [Bauldia sp.]|uniref:tellurite resistance TerB family protein n=1 Tax=Bauldia sp. TaxID=2575872 RepID=UPI001DF21887|nr:tellurite resistance TerB family protein [Bauldia sp.]MCB1494686.1 tellurite resistance TerB family protein [Bauldia sp.]